MEQSQNILKINNLSVGYKDKVLVNGIGFAVGKGSLVALMGLNGSGKTSFFKTLLGEINSLSGDVFIGDKSIKEINIEEHISVVYTEKIDVFGLTVYDIVSLGRQAKLNWLGILKDEDKQIVTKYIKALQLEGIKDEQINSLSDGQFQKVMIARALVQETPLILLDEPTAFLDVKNKKAINQLLKKLCAEDNKTIIVSTHDLDFCRSYCTKALLIKANEMKMLASKLVTEELFD